MYDPCKKDKDAHKVLLKAAFQEIGYHEGPIFPHGSRLQVTARFFLQDDRKDLDNMLKFFLDILQGPVFSNDRFVYVVVASKEPVGANGAFRSEIDIEKI